MNTGLDFHSHFERNVAEAFRELLSEKHLYQTVRVDTDYIDGVAKEQHGKAQRRVAAPSMSGSKVGRVPNLDTFKREGLAMYSMIWIPYLGIECPEGNPQATARAEPIKGSVNFKLPTILTLCPHCNGNWPFNPMEAGRKWEKGRERDSDQWFSLSYECQNCKGEPIRFLVRRARDKLTLCGREPIESVEVPAVIPKLYAKRYGSAIVAAQSGQVLAAIFLLRVFVEQYWLGIESVSTAISDIKRPTGDEIGSAYKDSLPEDFKRRFPNLCEVYGDLSAAMHSADERLEIYTEACTRVIEHFEARRLFRLDDA